MKKKNHFFTVIQKTCTTFAPSTLSNVVTNHRLVQNNYLVDLIQPKQLVLLLDVSGTNQMNRNKWGATVVTLFAMKSKIKLNAIHFQHYASMTQVQMPVIKFLIRQNVQLLILKKLVKPIIIVP